MPRQDAQHIACSVPQNCRREEAQEISDSYYDDVPSSGDGSGGGGGSGDGSDGDGGSDGGVSGGGDDTALPPVAEDKSGEHPGGGHVETKRCSPPNAKAEAGERAINEPNAAEHAGQAAEAASSSEGGAQPKEDGESVFFAGSRV